jgi:putative membrane protein
MDGWGWAMMSFGFLFWFSLIALGVWGIGHRAREGRAGADPEASPRDILDRRFARGEIDADAYRRAVEVLERRGESSER